jgi:glycosyltransferase involved in cell wall biosynthesis
VVIDALPTTNPSGRYVLTGHLARIAPGTAKTHRYTVLHHAGNADLRRDFGENVGWHECPPYTRHWLGRSLWEALALRRLLRRLGADLLLCMSGGVVPGIRLPQVTYAMNPWALVPDVHAGPADQLKAWFQRRAYRSAVKQAAAIAFLSAHLRELYRRDAGSTEKRSEVVPVGLDEETLWAAAQGRTAQRPRACQVLTVSVMGRHKGIETVVAALDLVRKRHAPAARLVLAGPWPDRRYQGTVWRQVKKLGLEGAVTFTGMRTRPELHSLYTEARVFALMSRCESFGIPALEAQAFGTPVVGSDSCAMPEVCGSGGFFHDPTDIGAAAAVLGRLLTDGPFWEEASRRAVENSRRFDWESCSRTLLRLLETAT